MRTLYHHWLSPSSRKIRIILGEKKLDHRLRVERPWAPSEELLNVNPAGRIPVLNDVNEIIISHDNAIVEYLEEAYPGRSLIGNDIYQRAETRRLAGWFDELFYWDVTHKIVYEKALKRHFSHGHPEPQTIREGLTNIHKHLCYIETLIDQRNWLSGDQFSLADIAAAAQLSCVDYMGDISWEKYPQGKEWYARIKSRPSFRSLLNDNIPGIAPPAHYANLDF